MDAKRDALYDKGGHGPRSPGVGSQARPGGMSGEVTLKVNIQGQVA